MLLLGHGLRSAGGSGLCGRLLTGPKSRSLVFTRLPHKIVVTGDQFVQQRPLCRDRCLDALLLRLEGYDLSMLLVDCQRGGGLCIGKIMPCRPQLNVGLPAATGERVHRTRPIQHGCGVAGQQDRQLFEVTGLISDRSDSTTLFLCGLHGGVSTPDIVRGPGPSLFGRTQPQPAGIKRFGDGLGRISQVGQTLPGARNVFRDLVYVVGSGRAGSGRHKHDPADESPE